MIRTRIILSVLALAFSLDTLATAQIYQYTDKNGNVVFTDRPPAESKAGEVKLNDDRVFRSAPRRAGSSSPATSTPAEEQRRKRDYSEVNAIMYMTNW